MRALILRGGLGNQLFQFAAGLSILRENFVIWTSAGEPRRTLGEVDLTYFTLPSQLSIEDGPNSSLIRKLLAWNLVLGLKSAESKRWKALCLISKFSSAVYFSVTTRTRTKLVPGSGVGFFDLRIRNRELILNGYFQSDFWASDKKTNEILHQLKIASPSNPLLHWIEIIHIANPIIVHVRLGDYRSEAGIGILNSNYFYRALSSPILRGISKNVWIFTDEPSAIEVNKLVPTGYKTRVFDDLSLSPAETLELMRNGAAYVISNSTFSWWAAFLSYNRSCPRFMPTPWFKNSKSPLGIKPLEWIEVDEPF